MELSGSEVSFTAATSLRASHAAPAFARSEWPPFETAPRPGPARCVTGGAEAVRRRQRARLVRDHLGMDRVELLAVVDGGHLEQLVGVREDVEVEFKRQPYQLVEEGEKFELAKDVAALANANGGAIVIGVWA